MKIAVPTNDGLTISEHFGRSAAFAIFEIANGKITSRELRSKGEQHHHAPGDCGHHAEGAEHHKHAGILAVLEGCDTVICSGMGRGAAEALKGAGTQVFVVAPAPVDDVVAAYLQGKVAARSEEFCPCKH